MCPAVRQFLNEVLECIFLNKENLEIMKGKGERNALIECGFSFAFAKMSKRNLKVSMCGVKCTTKISIFVLHILIRGS